MGLSRFRSNFAQYRLQNGRDPDELADDGSNGVTVV